jgi:hypothetical protein
MAKTAAQRAARRRRKKAAKLRKAGGVRMPQKMVKSKSKKGPIFRNPVPVRKGLFNGNRSLGNGVSMVNDGVNTGSIWKNTTTERVTFPMAREKFTDLNSTGTTLQTLVQQYINPGNTELFPIFSKIAQNYEQYECNHLKIMFRTEEYMASGSVVSAGLGCLATNFDPDAANFATFTQSENYEHSISGAPFSGIIVHDVLEEHRKRFGRGRTRNGGDLSLNNYYVNYAPNQLAPGATPAKFYDMGNFQFLVNGTQAGLIGELWIEYSFTLIRRLQTPGAPQGGVAHFSSIAATTANNFASAVLQPGYTLAGLTLGANTIVFPAGVPGNYLAVMTVAGGTSASAVGNFTGYTAALNYLTQSGVRDATSEQVSLAGTTTSPAMTVQTFTIGASATTVTVSTASTIVGTGSMDLWIFALPSTVVSVDEKEQEEINELQDKVCDLESRMQLMLRKMESMSRPSSSAEDDFGLVDVDGAVGVSASAPPPRVPPRFKTVFGDRIPPANRE